MHEGLFVEGAHHVFDFDSATAPSVHKEGLAAGEFKEHAAKIVGIMM
jgi:hypothetical protein